MWIFSIINKNIRSDADGKQSVSISYNDFIECMPFCWVQVFNCEFENNHISAHDYFSFFSQWSLFHSDVQITLITILFKIQNHHHFRIACCLLFWFYFSNRKTSQMIAKSNKATDFVLFFFLFLLFPMVCVCVCAMRSRTLAKYRMSNKKTNAPTKIQCGL